jgi:hypothetical protein
MNNLNLEKKNIQIKLTALYGLLDYYKIGNIDRKQPDLGGLCLTQPWKKL